MRTLHWSEEKFGVWYGREGDQPRALVALKNKRYEIIVFARSGIDGRYPCDGVLDRLHQLGFGYTNDPETVDFQDWFAP